MAVDGIVYDGYDAEAIWIWCRHQVGPGRCNYTWAGVRGWHITVTTPNGHEILRAGDAVVRAGDDQLMIVRNAQEMLT